MRFEVLYKIGDVIHKAAKMYHDYQEHSASLHAKDLKGKVRDRKTGKIIHDHCPESKEKDK